MRLQSVTIDCAIIDSQLDCVEGKAELIVHEGQAAPAEPVEENAAE